MNWILISPMDVDLIPLKPLKFLLGGRSLGAQRLVEQSNMPLALYPVVLGVSPRSTILFPHGCGFDCSEATKNLAWWEIPWRSGASWVAQHDIGTLYNSIGGVSLCPTIFIHQKKKVVHCELDLLWSLWFLFDWNRLEFSFIEHNLCRCRKRWLPLGKSWKTDKFKNGKGMYVCPCSFLGLIKNYTVE